MLGAERIAPIPEAAALPEHDAVSTAELRAELRRILQGSLP
jgi:hypothetical protein